MSAEKLIKILFLGGNADGTMREEMESDAWNHRTAQLSDYSPGVTIETKKYGKVRFFISMDLSSEETRTKLDYWKKQLNE